MSKERKTPCHCGMADCERLHKAIQDQASSDHVWNESPYTFFLHSSTRKLQSWIFVLALCHHYPGFKKRVADTEEGKTVRLTVCRHHFPVALLDEHRREALGIKTHMSQLLRPETAELLAKYDVDQKTRLIESCNTVGALIKRAKQYLPVHLLEVFHELLDGLDSSEIQQHSRSFQHGWLDTCERQVL